MSTSTVEIIYRGVFQKTLAKNICRGVVLAARKEGKIGLAFGRYSDSPERNGIPAKQFAVVAHTEEELQEFLSRYEPDNNDITIVTDDTLCKGAESWSWNGLQPVNTMLKPGGTLLVASMQSHDDLVKDIHRRDQPYHLAVVKGSTSFSGMFVYKDDHTDVRLLGALASLAPHVVGLGAVTEAIREQWKSDLKVDSAKRASDLIRSLPIRPGQGNPETPHAFELPGWKKMGEGLAIPGIPVREHPHGWDGGFVPGRSPTFKKFSTRTQRPVVNFDTCKKCTLCWLQCPDSSFNIAADGLYDPDLEACCGCGVCEAVCPVAGCVTMVREEVFQDNQSQWQRWSKDKAGYKALLAGWTAHHEARSHGYHHRGQYAEEIANETR